MMGREGMGRGKSHICQSGGSGRYIEEAMRSEPKVIDVWTSCKWDVIMGSVFKPCIQMCIYVYKALLILFSVV